VAIFTQNTVSLGKKDGNSRFQDETSLVSPKIDEKRRKIDKKSTKNDENRQKIDEN
jgi:hypothetical protein